MGIRRSCPGTRPFSFSTFECERVCLLHSGNKNLLMAISHDRLQPPPLHVATVSLAVLLLALRFNSALPPIKNAGVSQTPRPSVSLRACWFSLQTVYHSIRSDGAINQTMSLPPLSPPCPSLETSLRDWFGGNSAYIREWYRTAGLGTGTPVKSVFLGPGPSVGAKDNTDSRARPTFHFTPPTPPTFLCAFHRSTSPLQTSRLVSKYLQYICKTRCSHVSRTV